MWKAAQIPTQEGNVYHSGNILRVLREEGDKGSLQLISLLLRARSLHLWAKAEVKKKKSNKNHINS